METNMETNKAPKRKVTKIIKIVKSSNPLLWYSKYIGDEYEVKRWETTETGKKHAWVYEIYQGHRFLNWVDSRDYVLVA